MIVKLLTQHHLEFLSLKEECTGSSESTLVKMPHCWKSHAAAHFVYFSLLQEAQDIFGVDYDYEEFKDYGEDESEEEDEVLY